MLVTESIQSVQSLYSKGVQSKDSRLSTRHIYYELITARSTVFKQQLNKRQKVNEANYQPLSCIDLEEAPKHECPIVGCDIKILRSKKELPKIISNLDKLMIEYVTDLDGGIRFEKTKFENVKYLSGDKFTGTKPKYYIKYNRLYIVNRKILKGVSANVLAEDPIEAALFGSCSECNCDDVTDFDFYTDRDSFKAIAQIAQQQLIIMFDQIKQDNLADANDDADLQGKMIHQGNDN